MPALRARRAEVAPISEVTNLHYFVSPTFLGGGVEAYAEPRMQGKTSYSGTRLSYTQIYTASGFVGGRTAFRCFRAVWLRTGSGAS